MHECFVNKNYWAYFELSNKYRTTATPEQMGKALKVISERIRNYKEELEEDLLGCGLNSNNIVIDDLIEILNKQSTDWNGILNGSNIMQSKRDDISSLKKRIKYCKNPIEKKKLEQELNLLHEKRKRGK